MTATTWRSSCRRGRYGRTALPFIGGRTLIWCHGRRPPSAASGWNDGALVRHAQSRHRLCDALLRSGVRRPHGRISHTAGPFAPALLGQGCRRNCRVHVSRIDAMELQARLRSSHRLRPDPRAAKEKLLHRHKPDHAARHDRGRHLPAARGRDGDPLSSSPPSDPRHGVQRRGHRRLHGRDRPAARAHGTAAVGAVDRDLRSRAADRCDGRLPEPARPSARWGSRSARGSAL